jgi:hypothetical protein
MFNIGSFFERFNNIALKEMRTRDIISQSIEKYTKAKIEAKDIRFQNKIIYIQANPSLKSQIFMKKEAIISEIKTGLPGMIIEDVR